jgi:D-glycero-D-manno-heptose 1,7-bisphosphate phosphatase
MNRAVFLDRDGVLNGGVVRDGHPFAPSCLEEFSILPGVPEALQALRTAGYRLIVVTNQPDVARGLTTRANIDAIHALMRERLPLDDIRVCFHDDVDVCVCRKPRPGLVIAAAVDHEIQVGRSYMIGDRWRDLGAGKAAGCTTILVNRFHEELLVTPDVELPDLPEAARWILNRTPPASIVSASIV